MVKECKTRHYFVGKILHWELCKKVKFDSTNKWCMYKPECVLENETHEILWDFEIQMDPPIPDKKSDLVMIYK